MPKPSSVLVQNPLGIQTLKSPSLSEQPIGDVLEYRISETMLWLCTVDIRERRAHFLPISTYVIFKGSDILKTIEGLLWQTTRREKQGLLWQANPKQPSSKPPKKNFAPWLCPPRLWGFFLTHPLKYR
ncbi:MAG TPA: hypothetical protein VD811_07405 [Desulfuromonadales bacterium]|nr:hypothetical protein [Desulfuromonadales bacterium]